MSFGNAPFRREENEDNEHSSYEAHRILEKVYRLIIGNSNNIFISVFVSFHNGIFSRIMGISLT